MEKERSQRGELDEVQARQGWAMGQEIATLGLRGEALGRLGCQSSHPSQPASPGSRQGSITGPSISHLPA